MPPRSLPNWATALFPVARNKHTRDAIAFLIYDVPKVLMLLTLFVFASGVLRSWFSPEKIRAIQSGRREVLGYPLTAANGLPEERLTTVDRIRIGLEKVREIRGKSGCGWSSASALAR